MARLSAVDVIIILAVLALLVFVGTREFAQYGERVFPEPNPTAAAGTS